MKDALTTLKSSTALDEYLLTCKHPKLFLIDIRNFKQINLTHSDEGGNFILCSFAKALLSFAQLHEMELFRFKNDQFILLLDQTFELSTMEKIIFVLLDVLKEQSYTYHDVLISPSFRIGISFDHIKPIQKAQKALLVAKAEEQLFVTYSEFANTLMEESEEKIAQLVDQAIAEKQIQFDFQPIVDKNLHVIYYESLLRLECYSGLQSPKLFLKIAREKKFFDTLLSVSANTIKHFLTLKKEPLALNLSSCDLGDSDRMAFLIHTFAQQNIIIEIQCEETEHLSVILDAIQQFKHVGIATALDNVEDASILACFPAQSLSYIKVHGDIIRNLEIDEHAKTKALALLDAAKKLGAQCIATHINSSKSTEAAQAFGFKLFQGYSFELPHPF
ncbi:MAG: EAL domain-containing protein [Sulfurospirillaceae bacterium]|nr:EAL domain-containing protein [Sulfurospirillaceae bacterium]MDD2826909.1 EAL domain-containing protein [Sulfurospirillaceae bacterium]